MRERMWKVDLHTHTDRSPDAAISPAVLVERAFERGLDRIAITDHGEIEGALEARGLAPELVIVGEEVKCACGTELIGLFLRERIPEGLALDEVVERIRGQEGVIYAPHPYAYPWRPLRRARRALAVAEVIEAWNARAFFRPWNRAALYTARRRGMPTAAASDAHFPGEIGRAYTSMPAFQGSAGFREAIGAAHLVGRELTGVPAHIRSTGLKLARHAAELLPVGSGLPRPRTAER